ncbi:MAG TPA: CoA ester lyase [Blastocatellia bacterium]|nr:CoA ester lyase [Blastocatellia bacterium]
MRSLLYVPGISERMILKARDSAADGLILDLEDAVAPDRKVEARATVVRSLNEIDFGGKEIIVRINALVTEWGLEDARAVVAVGAPGLVIPKCESVEDVTTVAPIMQSKYHQPIGGQTRKLLCLIETPRGVFASREIAESNELVAGLMFGAADLSRDLGAVLSEDETEVLFARSHVLLAARAAGVAAYDSPHFEIDDLEGLRRRCLAARNLGYDGKMVIHPSHIEIVNEIFAPTAQQIAEAERVIEAMAAAQAEGRGVIRLDGKMIDQVHLEAARKVLEKAHRQSGD